MVVRTLRNDQYERPKDSASKKLDKVEEEDSLIDDDDFARGS